MDIYQFLFISYDQFLIHSPLHRHLYSFQLGQLWGKVLLSLSLLLLLFLLSLLSLSLSLLCSAGVGTQGTMHTKQALYYSTSPSAWSCFEYFCANLYMDTFFLFFVVTITVWLPGNVKKGVFRFSSNWHTGLHGGYMSSHSPQKGMSFSCSISLPTFVQ